jgi:hypothetical protein
LYTRIAVFHDFQTHFGLEINAGVKHVWLGTILPSRIVDTSGMGGLNENYTLTVSGLIGTFQGLVLQFRTVARFAKTAIAIAPTYGNRRRLFSPAV